MGFRPKPPDSSRGVSLKCSLLCYSGSIVGVIAVGNNRGVFWGYLQGIFPKGVLRYFSGDLSKGVIVRFCLGVISVAKFRVLSNVVGKFQPSRLSPGNHACARQCSFRGVVVSDRICFGSVARLLE